MWIEQSHIWPFRLYITFGWLQKLNPGYEICIISYQVNLSSEVSAMFNSLMPSLNSRSLPFVVFLGGFPSRCQNLSSGAIRPGGLLLMYLVSSGFSFKPTSSSSSSSSSSTQFSQEWVCRKVVVKHSIQGNSVTQDLPPPTGSEANTTIYIYILDIDSHCPYLLSGETTFHLTSCSNSLYLLFGETTFHLTNQWWGHFSIFPTKTKILMLKIAGHAKWNEKGFF